MVKVKVMRRWWRRRRRRQDKTKDHSQRFGKNTTSYVITPCIEFHPMNTRLNVHLITTDVPSRAFAAEVAASRLPSRQCLKF